MQYFGGREVDASLLLMPLVGFLSPNDPRILGTVAAVERCLSVDGLLLRYNTGTSDDGLPPGEGPSLPAVSGWLTTWCCRDVRRGAGAVRKVACVAQRRRPAGGRV